MRNSVSAEVAEGTGGDQREARTRERGARLAPRAGGGSGRSLHLFCVVSSGAGNGESRHCRGKWGCSARNIETVGDRHKPTPTSPAAPREGTVPTAPRFWQCGQRVPLSAAACP